MRSALRVQVEYYFSPANLARDRFLSQQMDAQGWVPLATVARFNRILTLLAQLREHDQEQGQPQAEELGDEVAEGVGLGLGLQELRAVLQGSSSMAVELSPDGGRIRAAGGGGMQVTGTRRAYGRGRASATTQQ